MSLRKNSLGKLGEDHAVLFLERNGFTVIERNFLIRGGEIDIIALDRSEGKENITLVFVEVKTRTTTEYGDPIEAIGYYKMKSLIRSAEYYKLTHKNLPDLMRIDAVTILYDEENKLQKIRLVKNIS